MRKPEKHSRAARLHLAALVCLALALVGCDGAKARPGAASTPLPLAGVKFRLLVVDDPAIATAAKRLNGEWHAQTGSDFDIIEGTENDLAVAKTIDADAVICSPAMIGTLAAGGRIVALPEKLLRGGAGQWSDIFALPQLREAAWGSQIMAVPLGSPVLTCCYRADLLAKIGRQPPQTWEEYQELAQLLGRQKSATGTWYGAIEPLRPGWAGLTLLSRAAPYAKHRDNYSALFDIKTMEPLVAGPPMVLALEELVAAAKLGPADSLQYDPAAVWAEFYRGHCGLALCWPTAAAAKSPLPEAAGKSALCVGFAELPGSPRAYNVGNQTWEVRAEDVDPHVPLLGVAGRMAAVTASAQRPEAVFQLLLWLSGEQSARVCPASPATTLFRHSHLKSPQEWTDKSLSPAAAAQYAAVTQKTLDRADCLLVLRLPGRAEYLAALDEAVHRAVQGKASPAEALRQAAARWREINQRLGVEQQRSTYLHSLGLEEGKD